MYIEAGYLGERLREGIAAAQSGRLLSNYVSVFAALIKFETVLRLLYLLVSEVREITVVETRSVLLIVYSCCFKLLPSPTVYSMR